MNDLLPAQASEILRIHPSTLKRYERKGLIGSKRDFNGWRRFSLDDVLKLKRLLENRDHHDEAA